MRPNGVPKSKSPSTMVDEMVSYQYASKSHIIIARMFFIKTSYKFVSLLMSILNPSCHHLARLKFCLINKFASSFLCPLWTSASQNVEFLLDNYLMSLPKITIYYSHQQLGSP
jgi:hypothetical protein